MRERAALAAALAEVAAGRGQIVSVLGEAGIGKTRLTEECRRGQPELRWLEGRALSYGQALPFWTIVQLIKADLGLSEADPEARVKVVLRRRVAALFGEQAGEALPFLSLVLGAALEPEVAQRLRSLDEAALKRQIQQALDDYFARLAAEQPTVLVFEDVHWADPSTLQALESLLALTDRAPLMLLLLARAERDQGWWAVKRRADTDYAHRYTEIASVPIPDTLHGVLLARIDRLSDDVRHTLQVAAVIGKSFCIGCWKRGPRPTGNWTGICRNCSAWNWCRRKRAGRTWSMSSSTR